MDGGGRLPSTSVMHETIGYVCFVYVCDLVRAWRPPTSYGVHTLLLGTPMVLKLQFTLLTKLLESLCNLAMYANMDTYKIVHSTLRHKVTVFNNI